MAADDLAPEDVEAKHAEIEKDTAAGNGAKHFEDLLDDIHSNPSQQHAVEDAPETVEQREKRERDFNDLARGIKARLNQMLGTDTGLLVKRVRRNVGGRGFLVEAVDRARREYDAVVDFEEFGKSIEASIDSRFAVTSACELIVRRILEARENYHRRAGLM
jgi:hypothetical protein